MSEEELKYQKMKEKLMQDLVELKQFMDECDEEFQRDGSIFNYVKVEQGGLKLL